MSKAKREEKDLEKDKKSCGCNNENCDCGDDCKCGDDCHCGDDCDCDEECHCGEDCDCEDECGCEEEDVCDDGYLNMLQRLQADFDNYRKRTNNMYADGIETGIAIAIKEILPLMDSFLNAKKQTQDKGLLDTIDKLQNQFAKGLSNLKVEKIEAVGKPFDPNFHEAVLTDHVDGKAENEVLEEFQEGFMLNGKVVRHTMVKVNK